MPLRGYWDKSVPAKCGVNETKYFLGKSIPDTVIDLFIMVIPLHSVWRLHVTPMQKVILTLTFLMGGLATITSIIRLVCLLEIDLTSEDTTWNFVPYMIWTCVELNVGTIAEYFPSAQFAMTDHPLYNTYLLKRNRAEATRLGSQHLLWKLHMNHVLHPDIPIKENMAIADIGAGTGFTLRLESQRTISPILTFPLPEYRPSNATFDVLDFLGELPSSLVGQCDVVHLRAWAFIIRDNGPSRLIQNAAKMLKPGGYIQWEDARFNSAVVRGDAALKMRQMMSLMSGATKLNFEWVEKIDQHVNLEADLEVIDCQYKPWSNQLILLCMDTFFVALENSGAILDRLKQVEPSVPSSDEWMSALENVQKESRNADQLYWHPVTLLARKSG
ncbi:hypothetical protein N7454_002982 [Penicillium verhagenii]|nr:hypothetical protein N7454_002982 [Penicillium verhagenii]